ncbi:MAG: cell envelope integrity protein CreD [Cyclobacteriaceae bacterium]|nr:cell envelope integrity protein CreD [Cyclobacteriaceae bacterium]
MEQPSTNLFERLNRWIQESITVKMMSIGFLILILLIPASWIKEVIVERQQRAADVMQEVADKWSGSQTISGPVLVVPYRKQIIIDRGKDGTEIREQIEKAFFLPEDLTISGTINPQTLHRGIFDAVVYESSMSIKSVFNKPDFKALAIPDDRVQWGDAYMVFGITDLRGISDNPLFTVGGLPLSTEPSKNLGISVQQKVDSSDDDYMPVSSDGNHFSSHGIIAKLKWEQAENFNGNVVVNLNLKGSRRLDFVPVGKTTSVTLSGPWRDPSFDGEFLPAEREITTEGFSASWKVLHFNRPFLQSWKEGDQKLSGADFGLKLLIPVDQYQKSMRTSKYGQLIILLTFVALFMVEISQKIRIHPFQYILIGAALIIYYILLLSISEHLGYNLSYIISTLATVALISFYSTTFLKRRGLVILFTTLLIIFYSFIFIIILQQDFSLLLGSIGLFLIIAALMYFSRKINWYHDTTKVSE